VPAARSWEGGDRQPDVSRYKAASTLTARPVEVLETCALAGLNGSCGGERAGVTADTWIRLCVLPFLSSRTADIRRVMQPQPRGFGRHAALIPMHGRRPRARFSNDIPVPIVSRHYKRTAMRPMQAGNPDVPQ